MATRRTKEHIYHAVKQDDEHLAFRLYCENAIPLQQYKDIVQNARRARERECKTKEKGER